MTSKFFLLSLEALASFMLFSDMKLHDSYTLQYYFDPLNFQVDFVHSVPIHFMCSVAPWLIIDCF